MRSASGRNIIRNGRAGPSSRTPVQGREMADHEKQMRVYYKTYVCVEWIAHRVNDTTSSAGWNLDRAKRDTYVAQLHLEFWNQGIINKALTRITWDLGPYFIQILSQEIPEDRLREAMARIGAAVPQTQGTAPVGTAPVNTVEHLLNQFLIRINGFVQAKNEASLDDYIALEPPFSDEYQQMQQDLKKGFSGSNAAALEKMCDRQLVAARDGFDGNGTWLAFIKFVVQYLNYLRDVDGNPDNYLKTYELLSEMQVRANSALNHPALGSLMLPIVVKCAKLVSRLAIGLDRRPELIRHLRSGADEGGTPETLPERAANIVRQAFVTCLNDRSSGLKDGKPEGKKRGIYIIANLCLKILFQCKKSRNGLQIFENIYNLSPPLDAYPKAQRVTYLFYLGRFLFANSHFYRAHLTLQEAYNLSPAHPDCVKQRRIILVYLTTCNIIMGRMPSKELLARPEAQGFAENFGPIMTAMRTGNLALFRQATDIKNPKIKWLRHWKIFLQMKNRCEVHVWRSLVRKVWLLVGQMPEAGSKAAPNIDLGALITVFDYLEKQARGTKPEHKAVRRLKQKKPDPKKANSKKPETDGVNSEKPETDRVNSKKPETDRANGEKKEKEKDPRAPRSDLTAAEWAIISKLSSLVTQGFLRGFIAWKARKFLVAGVKNTGGDVLAAGFPLPWKVVSKDEETDVPGWKLDVNRLNVAGPGTAFA